MHFAFHYKWTISQDSIRSSTFCMRNRLCTTYRLQGMKLKFIYGMKLKFKSFKSNGFNGWCHFICEMACLKFAEQKLFQGQS